MSVTFFITGDAEGPEINLSNRNAQIVIESLGYEADEWIFDVDELDGKLLLAEAVGGRFPDCGFASIEEPRRDGPRVYDCGLRPGYLAERYGQLRELCARARRLGARQVVAT